MTAETLSIAEIFGPTFQGEGPEAGHRAGFVRLGACNLNCSWCDTPYTWDWKGERGAPFEPNEELTTWTFAEIDQRLLAMDVKRLVVTGGEPLLQQRSLCGFLPQLPETVSAVEVETNGTIVPLPELVRHVTRFNVSPKLANSDIPLPKRIRPDALRALHQTGKASFKFVAATPADIEEISELLATLDLHGADVWVMPEGTTSDVVLERMRILAPFVLEQGWNLTSRLQILLWGSRRGM